MSSPEPAPAPPPVIYVREQYEWKERKLITIATTGTLANYLLATKDAAIVMITTDSVIQYDVQDISADSPQMAGTTTTYDRVTFGIEKLVNPKTLYFKMITLSGTGNIWLVIGR